MICRSYPNFFSSLTRLIEYISAYITRIFSHFAQSYTRFIKC